MDKELQEQLNIIIQGMAQMDARMTQMDARMTQMDTRLTSEIRELAKKTDDLTGIMMNFENCMNNRMESLFDGYKLAHEKQWELERKVEKLEHRLQIVEVKVG